MAISMVSIKTTAVYIQSKLTLMFRSAISAATSPLAVAEAEGNDDEAVSLATRVANSAWS